MLVDLKSFDAVLILAGAGFSADSGLPVFRDTGGFWNAYPPLKGLNVGFSEVASPNFLDAHPELFTGFYAHRLSMYRETAPHAGYQQLRSILEYYGLDYHVVTTNVDGHFFTAGYKENSVCELHGSINWYQCSSPLCSKKSGLVKAPATLKSSKSLCASHIPLCESCNEVLRPNIVMFGDFDVVQSRIDEQEKRYRRWINNKIETDKRVLILEMGAGLGVPTLRVMHNQLLMTIPEWSGIRVNPNPDHSASTMYNMASHTDTAISFIAKIK